MIKDRLLKLAEHLESGKLAHKRFDFRRINVDWVPGARTVESAIGYCGTSGCALGELPIVFPDDWSFSASNKDKLVVDDRAPNTVFDRAQEFFELSEADCSALFAPESPRAWVGFDEDEFDDEPGLHGDASAKDVAQNIRDFVAWEEQQQ